MRKPKRRDDIPARRADNHKRKLHDIKNAAEIAALRALVIYGGSPKHKRNPAAFDLPPFNGERGDATLCDDHASFQPQDMARIPALITRGLNASLIGTNHWTIDDNGWIYEARLTNVTQHEYHAYPVRPNEAIAKPVYERFAEWADEHGSPDDIQAAENCAVLYEF